MRQSVIALVMLLCAGCASYVTPGGPVRLADLNPAAAADALQRQPSPPFPANLAVVRVQASEYESHSAKSIGEGPFSVVMSRELLNEQRLKNLSQWTSVDDVTTLDLQLLPSKLNSLDDLRLVAAKVQTDILLVYTVETAFLLQGKVVDPQSKISLREKPDADAQITSTTSVAFIDVRSGFTYGSTTATAKQSGLADAWASGDAVDKKRLETEQRAFTLLMTEGEKLWGGIVERYR